MTIEAGRGGGCAHYGEHSSTDTQVGQIRGTGEAPDGYVDDCGHPDHAGLHLKVSANSGCDGFAPAVAA